MVERLSDDPDLTRYRVVWEDRFDALEAHQERENV